MKIPSLSLLLSGFLVSGLASCGDSGANEGAPSEGQTAVSDNAPANSGAEKPTEQTPSNGAMTSGSKAADPGPSKIVSDGQLPEIEKSKEPARGKANGIDIEPTRVAFHRWALDFEIGDDLVFPDLGLRILFRKPLDRYAIPFGESFKVKPGDKLPLGLEVQIRRRHPETRANETVSISNDFLLELVFRKDTGDGGLFGRVHLVTPDANTYISGTFEAELKGERIDREYVEIGANSKQTLSFLTKKALEKKTGKKIEIVRAYEPRFQKTQVQLYLGFIEVDVLVDGQPMTQSAALARTLDGWSLDALLEKHQVPEAFPPLEPLMPPDGDPGAWVNFIVARRVQSLIDSEFSESVVTRYLNTVHFGRSCGVAKVKFKVDDKAQYLRFYLVSDDMGLRIDRQLAPEEKLDVQSCEITTKEK